MIHWLVQTTGAAPGLAEGIPPEGLLSAAERERLAGLKNAKRRREWLLGRWTAKRLIQSYVGGRAGHAPPLDSFAIVSAPDGAPEIAADTPGLRALSLSISHSADRALVAIDTEPGASVGADIERVERRGERFAEDYFTAAELALVRAAPAAERDLLVTAIWSAKEAALKALRLGLSVDTRAVECLPRTRATLGPGWAPCAVRVDAALLGRAAPPLRGWWRAEDGYVLTLAVTTHAEAWRGEAPPA